MKLTKKKAIKLSKEKWIDLAKTGDECIPNWYDKDRYGEMANDCALCEYALLPAGGSCKQCPYFKKFGGCMGSYFLKWTLADTPEDRKRYAALFLKQLEEL